ncbi:MAG: Fur family transcriptional regulator [Deferrisomatales bacterium]|nr:Fur family transcriptional regulator [Deferrisomatales bacterium]
MTAPDPRRERHLAEARRRLGEYLKERRLRATRQRDLILAAFLDHGSHASVDELYQVVRSRDPSVGHATVYRSMSLFVAAGIAGERRFHEGVSRYEPALHVDHHDHLVCEACGVIEEFEDPTIERLQEEAAATRGFRVHYHRLELYGLCRNCREP